MSEAQIKYKELIDGMVSISHSATATRLLGRPLDEDFQDVDLAHFLTSVVATLSPEQRELLAKILRAEKIAGIHDALAYITDYKLAINGVKLDYEPHTAGMHYDYMCRLYGDTWPDERNTTKEESA